MREFAVEVRASLGFSTADEARLKALHRTLSPAFPHIARAFQSRLLEQPEARRALEGGEFELDELEPLLLQWMNELFLGPYDSNYFERRERIGSAHERFGLPQHLMFGAMGFLRQRLHQHLSLALREDEDERQACTDAVNRALDFDLVLMMNTYQQALKERNVRAERLATYAQLIGSIGHELRNPLGVIETSLYVLRGRPLDEERGRKHLERISQQVTLTNAIITQLFDLIHDRPLIRQEVDLAATMTGALASLDIPPSLSLRVEGTQAPLLVQGDQTQLRQIIVNLVDNALSAAGPTGTIDVSLAHVENHIELSVGDSGPGIDPSIEGRLFEPLVTTKSTGIGLGLALVRRIVERHGGHITVAKSPWGGARFVIALPG